MDVSGEETAAEAETVWQYARASRAHVVIDADGYFELVRDAMLRARQRIFMIGWDFDTRIRLAARKHKFTDDDPAERYPTRLGAFVNWLARRNRALEVRLLKWNFAFFKSLLRGRMVLDLIGWARKRNIDFKYDSAHPTGASHHQKIVVIDDCFAVCGGIDVTSDRWDTAAHLHEDPRRVLPNGKPYRPWHDITMLMEGEVAAVLGDLGRERWRVAGGRAFPACLPQAETPWPQRLVAEFENVEIGIARTRAAYGDCAQISEVEALFVEQIRRAKRFFYAETQYFASRVIAEAIADRLDEADPPEFIIINPRNADGWLEQQAMDSARTRLVQLVRGHDHADRFRIYIPYTSGGTPIYVHAKLTIVDDEVVRVGSANMNNRSMGLDSECDVFIDMARAANAHVGPAITRIRHALLAEHCGVDHAEIAGLLDQHGSMRAMLDAMPREGKHIAPLPQEQLGDLSQAIADSQVLDPERPDEMFEPLAKRGLFRKGARLWHRRHLRHRAGSTIQ